MNRLNRDYFERIYADGDDPWGFETTWYEKRKQALTMAILPKERYTNVFEPGCASGELTRLLSHRADHVLALELMPNIAARAASRLTDCANAEVCIGAIPDDWPDQMFDLILLSEVAYYLESGAIQDVTPLIEKTLLPGGDLVLVHYLGETDYPLTGSEVHELLQAGLGWTSRAVYNETDFHALVLQR